MSKHIHIWVDGTTTQTQYFDFSPVEQIRTKYCELRCFSRL